MERAFSSKTPILSLANSTLYLFVVPTVALSVPFLEQELLLRGKDLPLTTSSM